MRLLRRGGARIGRVARGAVRTWRRSILVRVVGATLVLSVTVLALVGQLLLTGVRDGLLDAKVASSVTQADVGFDAARSQLAAAGQIGSANVGQILTQVVESLAQSRGARPYDVVLVPAPSTDIEVTPGRGFRTTGQVQAASVPEELRTEVAQKVAQDPDGLSYRFAALCYGPSDVPCPAQDREPEPGLAVGTQFRVSGAGAYQLFFLFPLTDEAETLSLVRGRLALGGALLTVLLAAIAFLVTRSVVRPVRAAAQVAERLASGRLAERMVERGEDELARLASSFNAMASALARQIRQLEDLSRLQRRFVSDVSHELRTPLTTIRMAADVLHSAREDFAAPVARSAELMHDQVERFEAMLAELLEISRFDAGAAVLEAEQVDVRDIARRVVESVDPVAVRTYGTSIRLELTALECLAEVDSRRIERILRNLMFNALEHGEGRGVVVRVASDANAVAIAVRDFGVGLRPGEVSLAFNRFWRADPARARRSGGTGLGLSIAREDARLHGGWLQAWGEPGAGAQFRLTLPRAAGGRLIAAPLPLEPADRPAPGGGPAATATGSDPTAGLQQAGRSSDA